MKIRILSTGLLIALLAVFYTQARVADQPDDNATPQEADFIPLEPAPQHRAISERARRYLSMRHYSPQPLNDQLSEQIFDEYLTTLDPAKAYFLAADIEDFERYRHKIDDLLKRSDLEPGFEIFNRYAKRVRQRIEYARNLLQHEPDFTVEDSFPVNHEDADWATSTRELDEYWRLRVKNDWLRLKLADESTEEIRETLDKRYTTIAERVQDFDEQDVFEFFMNAYMASIEPHTSYLSPRTSENFEIAMSLSLEGIGALLGKEGEYTIVRSLVPGGPAELDGELQPDDRIVGVGQGADGEIVDVVGWPIDDVVDLIRGEKGSEVRLQLLPADTGLKGPPQTVDIVRNEVQLEEQAAQASVVEVPQGESSVKVGLIRVPAFYLDFDAYRQNKPDYRSSTRDVRRLIGELRQQGVEGIIMDLRDNGGGSLLEAKTMTGLFIDQGPVVQVRDFRGRVKVHRDNEPGVAWNGPLVVLVNRYSASASEIFAGAIQDYRRGLIVGEPSFGKGTVQHLIDLDRGNRNSEHRMGQLKLTVAQFFRIGGGSTQNRGVIPDIRFPSAGDPAEYGESALDNALPWTRIEAADFSATSDLEKAVDMAMQGFNQRRDEDREFTYLREDIEDFEESRQEDAVSLLESERRREMEKAEARRLERREAREAYSSRVEIVPISGQEAVAETSADGGSETPRPPGSPGGSAGADSAAAGTSSSDSDGDETEAEEDDEAPDIYLEESARIAADLVRFKQKQQVLAKQAPGSDTPSGL